MHFESGRRGSLRLKVSILKNAVCDRCMNMKCLEVTEINGSRHVRTVTTLLNEPFLTYKKYEFVRIYAYKQTRCTKFL